MNFKRGFDFEDRICTKLEQIGCRLQRDQKLDHKYKLDFKVIAFPDNPGTYSLGVQVTAKRDDYEKQHEFEVLQKLSNVAHKSLYLELAGNLDLEDGGSLAVFTVICSFQFDRRFQDTKVQGAVINPDYTYEFFDIAERSRMLREYARQQVVEAHRPTIPAAPLQLRELESHFAHPGAALPGLPVVSNGTSELPKNMTGDQEGLLNAYKRSEGFGFTLGKNGETYFVHVNAIVDDRLKEELNQIPYSEFAYPVEIPVVFQDGGFTKQGAKYRAAKNIRMRQGAEAHTQ